MTFKTRTYQRCEAHYLQSSAVCGGCYAQEKCRAMQKQSKKTKELIRKIDLQIRGRA